MVIATHPMFTCHSWNRTRISRPTRQCSGHGDVNHDDLNDHDVLDDLPDSGHGDDDPVEGGGDVGEPGALALLNVVSQAGEGEAGDNQYQDLTNQRAGVRRL